MPELPEVETIARTLAPGITGRVITAVHTDCERSVQGSSLEEAKGQRCLVPFRRGKLLIIPFENTGLPSEEQKKGLVFHLRMTGRLIIFPHGTKPHAHTRLRFELDDGNVLFFDDTRKFGFAALISETMLKHWKFWQELGPEPLDIDSELFVSRFQGSRRTIKAMLLDQKVIAGCGNIYADESLFRAGIRPDASDISTARLRKLHQALREVLLESIEACGSSIRDYRMANGDAGSFQNHFRVYGRAKEPCCSCGQPLVSDKIAGRTTVYCPSCQTL
ncbi:MAG: bifunctional DNA-formamidopyrimidine glycosylase/DNA-(apurinic or apyrimidinic site) lyase [Desulfovibrionaceae bacterium]|nr:bifunctional DNA-formamidopyrimidine glycosylase/DNA-(apurinic or apyrimidinic site) lyase [Desulfovibrionaceae bacterium]